MYIIILIFSHSAQKNKNFRENLAFFGNFLRNFPYVYNFNSNFWKITPNFRASPNSKTLSRPSKDGPLSIWRTSLNRKILHALLAPKLTKTFWNITIRKIFPCRNFSMGKNSPNFSQFFTFSSFFQHREKPTYGSREILSIYFLKKGPTISNSY